jgi:TolA-binding protein
MRRAANLFLLFLLVAAVPAAGQKNEDGSVDGAARALRAEALAAMNAGDYAGAIGPLREFLARYPGHYAENTLLANCYLGAGRFEEAAAFLEEAVKRWAGDIQMIEMLGQAYLETGQPEKAVSVWHSVLTGNERDVPMYLKVSRAEWNAGMYDQAISTLKEARRFEKQYARLTAEIVRMEQTRGNYRGAFIEALPGFEMEDIPDLGRASGAIRSFREAGSPPELIAAVDSFASHGKRNAVFFQTLGAALRVDTGDYSRASDYLILAGSGKVPEQDVYSLVLHLYSLGGKAGDPAFESYLERASSTFVRRFGDSPRAPRVLLEAAGHAELAAGRGGAGERESALRAVALADSTISHRRGRPYMEKALLVKARVYLEHLHDPAAALRAVDGGQWRHPDTAAEAASIRLEALVLSGRWDEAMKRFEALCASPDSSLAASGKYGKGMVLFYRGKFEESAKLLSETAAEAPWGEWANDALATAVLIRRAESDDPAVLASFASAMSAGGSGRYGEAADSLSAVAVRFPGSPLAPEALYQSALLLERAGRHGESVAALEEVAGTWPLSRVAPRAVETLARLFEEPDPEASARWYALFLERYGDDPWVTRVRSRYIRLRKIMGGGTPGEDET